MTSSHRQSIPTSGPPSRIAVIMGNKAITFAELDAHVRRMAGWLWREGLRAGDMAGLSLGEEYAHLVACLALIRIGCPQVTLSTREPEGMRLSLAARCKVGCVITGDVPPQVMGGLRPEFDVIVSDRALEKVVTRPPDSEPLVFLPSSGTTGRCKIVCRTPGELVGYGLSGLPRHSVILGPASIESNVGKWSHLANLAYGRTLVLEGSCTLSLADTCARHGVTLVNLTPSGAAALLRESDPERSRRAFAKVRFSVGGAPVSGPLRRDVQRVLTRRLFVLYGATECGNATAAGPELHAEHPNAVGYPLPGVDIGVVDDAGRPLPPGELGWVRIRSRVGAVGYFDDEPASVAAFRDGWFHPGDMGRMTHDGILVYCGRGDDMMVLNTINIFPAEIEAVAEPYPGVRECAAFPIPFGDYGDVPILAVAAGQEVEEAALLAYCRDRLGTRAPRKVFRIESLPRNVSGKVMRHELVALFQSRERRQ